MRHQIHKKKLGRKSQHLKHTFINLSLSLIRYGRIKTTLAKAKALRPFIEPLIHRAKIKTLHNQRILLSRLKNPYIVSRLFKVIAPIYLNRNGGYTRIYKLSRFRFGDASKMALIELVDRNMFVEEEATNKEENSKKD